MFGVKLQSPFVIGSGPLSYSGEAMVKLHQAGAGAVVTKTIRLKEAVNPVPHMLFSGNGSLINCEKWADLPPKVLIEKEISYAKKHGVVVIASIGHTLPESKELVREVARAGADMIELVSYDENDLAPMTMDAKSKVDIPVIVKLSPNGTDVAKTAAECLAAGADGLTACDSLGPVLRIDIATGRPLMAGPNGYGWLSGAAIKPVILQRVAELRRRFTCPIIGLGGVSNAQDALEITMAGANLIGVCSVIINRGAQYIGKMNAELEALLSKLGYSELSEAMGKVIPHLYPEEKLGKLNFNYQRALCNGCRRCVDTCPYEARTLGENKELKKSAEDRVMKLDEEKCRFCGFCSSVCPTKALTYSPSWLGQ